MDKNKPFIMQGISDYEESTVLPKVVRILQRAKGKRNAISNTAIRNILREYHKISIVDTRVRKIINFIRLNHYLNYLLATSTGYYISNDYNEIESYILSLKQREREIKKVRQCIEQDLYK